MWGEITWQPIVGQAAVAVTLKWFVHEADVDPWYVETISFSTIDRAVNDTRVTDYVATRAAVVAEMYARYLALAAALNIQAGVRFPIGGTP